MYRRISRFGRSIAMTDFQMNMIAEMFLDIIKSSKDLKEAEERILAILRNSKNVKTSSQDE